MHIPILPHQYPLNFPRRRMLNARRIDDLCRRRCEVNVTWSCRHPSLLLPDLRCIDDGSQKTSVVLLLVKGGITLPHQMVSSHSVTFTWRRRMTHRLRDMIYFKVR